MEQRLSLAIAVVLFLTYLCVLSFSLKTHRHFFQGIEGELEEKSEYWSRSKAVIILLVATGFVALLAEFLVGTIESVRATFGLTETFVGVIVVAIVGNAAEHSSAILMALKNKMDLTVGIAIGSSLQIALFVAPLLLFVSYLFGKPMDLEFSLPEVFAVVASVYILFQISGDGETNWIEGVQLLSVYVILGILFFYLPEAVGRTATARASLFEVRQEHSCLAIADVVDFLRGDETGLFFEAPSTINSRRIAVRCPSARSGNRKSNDEASPSSSLRRSDCASTLPALSSTLQS